MKIYIITSTEITDNNVFIINERIYFNKHDAILAADQLQKEEDNKRMYYGKKYSVREHYTEDEPSDVYEEPIKEKWGH